MTTNEFIRFYSNEFNMPMTQARREIENFISAFKSATYSNGIVDMRGFMKSEVVDVPAKTARNPKTGELVSIPPKKVVKVKVASKFKNLED